MGQAKDSVVVEADRIHWHLDNWGEWLHEYSLGLGYPPRSSGMGSTASLDFDEMCHAADARCAAAVDAIIDALDKEQRQAIYHKHIASCYWVGKGWQEAYNAGCEALGGELNARGIE